MPDRHDTVTCRLVALLYGAELARLVDRQLRAEPVRVFLVAGEQHAELVDAGDDFVHQDALAVLQVPVAAGELVHRDDGRIARVIGVVHGRPVHDLGALPHRQVVGDRDGLAVRDQEAVEVAGLGRPGAHARGRAGLHQVDSRAAAEVEALAVAREILFVRAPAELGGLLAFAHEAVDRPGVDELVELLRLRCELRVALGDVDDLDAERARELRPVVASTWASRRRRRCRRRC